VIALVGELPQPFVADTSPASPAEVAGDESAGDDFHGLEHAPQRAVETASHRRGALVELVVELDGGQISHEDLQALQAGDIITTCQGADEPLIATVDGQPRFLVRPGSLGGQKAIEVQREIAEPAAEASRRAG
jgi:flagellar motor switch protein FliM